MFDLQKAILFIAENGSEIEKTRMDSILGNKIDLDKQKRNIKLYQNKDGGFSLSKNGLSNLSDTEFILTWVSDLKLLSDDIALSCFDYLEKQQNEDGSWQEVEYENKQQTPEWMEARNVRAVLFQSANTLFWLYKYDENSKSIKKGLSFLETSFSLENAYIHTKWLIASILSKKYSWDNKKVKDLLTEIIESICKETSSSMITWMLWSFSIYGIPKESGKIKEIIRKIQQDKDGGIDSEDGEAYRVNATIERIKVLQYYGE